MTISDFLDTYKRLIQHTETNLHRYLFPNFRLDNRLIGLIGARGTGKTTLMLQFIKENLPLDDCIYVSLDHLFFAHNNLVDFTKTLIENYGVRYCFFDEAHKYADWNQALKNLYDMYPDVTFVFSGSSSLDLVKGGYDLSRRGVVYRLAGLSFREYLYFRGVEKFPTIGFEDLLKNRSDFEMQIAQTPKLLGYFKDYLGAGYYPFVFEDEASYSEKLHRTIEKTIYEDIANFYQLKTDNLRALKAMIAYMATIPPGTLNVNNIAKNLQLDNKTVRNYLDIMAETQLITLVQKNKAGSQLLKKTEKMYLNNADLYQSVAEAVGFDCVLGTQREIFFVNMLENVGINVHYSDIGDFEARGYCFEIGGKHKTTKQIRDKIDNAFVVKDDVLYGSRYEIPLYLLGFLY